MNPNLHEDALHIVTSAIDAVKPDAAVRRALQGATFPGRVFLVAVGKAGWQMAHAALQCLPTPPAQGIVVTKYGHVLTDLPGIRCLEAGHPVPDENTFAATQAVLDMTADLSPADTVLFLLSGGGSALFESPLVPGAELQAITRQLLACGADIVEMNTIRKRLSEVKGGRFAAHCAPAGVQTIVLSDILGDPPDMIASGPAASDLSTCDEALKIAEKYDLQLSPAARTCLGTETPRHLDNVQMQIIGSVREICAAAAAQCRALGYEPLYLTDRLNCEAREAGRFLAAIARSHANDGKKLAFIAGGETVVRLTGSGLGGRNQEIALAAAENLSGLSNAAVISIGSDGTDGPTGAAGGYADGGTQAALASAGWNIADALRQNDAYHALQTVNGHVHTGPTGTNVNDVAIALVGE